MKLKEICEIFTDGDWIETKDQSTTGIRLVQTGNVGIGLFKSKADKARYISEETFKRLRCTEVFAGDLLVSRLPEPVGRACIIPTVKGRMITAVDCTIIRPKKDLVLAEYLLMFMMSSGYFKEVEAACTGTTRKRISRKNLGNIELSVPPLEEQYRIVARLDVAFKKIDKAIENTEKNLRNSQELFKLELLTTFNELSQAYGETELQEITRTSAGGTPLKTHKEYYDDGTIPWLLSGEVNNRNIIETKNKITEIGLKNSSAKLFPIDTVVVAMYGATAGQVGILKIESTTNQAVCAILPGENHIPEYIYYAFVWAKDGLIKKAVGGAQPNISQIKIKQTRIPVPGIEEQKEAVKKLDMIFKQTHKLQRLYQQKIYDLQALKQSLLREAFSACGLET